MTQRSAAKTENKTKTKQSTSKESFKEILCLEWFSVRNQNTGFFLEGGFFGHVYINLSKSVFTQETRESLQELFVL